MRGLRPFLQQCLRGLARRAHRSRDDIAHRPMHQILRSRESALDVARADYRIVEARHEPSATAAAGLLFAASKARAFREAQLPADLRKRTRGHKRGAKPR